MKSIEKINSNPLLYNRFFEDNRDFLLWLSLYHTIIYFISGFTAGIMCAPYEITEDGLESHFAVNYLGHFLLTQLLLPALEEASKTFPTNPRIVNVSSSTHELAPKINFEDINMT